MFRKLSVFAATLSLLTAFVAGAQADRPRAPVERVSAAVVVGKLAEAPSCMINISAVWYKQSGALVGQTSFNSAIDSDAPAATAYIATSHFTVSAGVFHSWATTMYMGKWGRMDFWADQSTRGVKINFTPAGGHSVTLLSGTIESGGAFLISN
jgi:hypothetical protein